MSSPLDQLLTDLRKSEGDSAASALAVADFACAKSPELKRVLMAAAMPHWFTLESLVPLLDDELRSRAVDLHSQLVGLPMIEDYPERQAHAVHDQTRVALAQDASPDLTHVRIVHAGETLAALCTAIYGDPRYAPGVARANGLDGFRQLAAGTRVVFPPLEK